MSGETKIIQIGNRVLRKRASEIPRSELESKETRTLIKKMKEALRKENLGIGLAAPQIGASKAVFIVSEYVLMPDAFRETLDGIKQAEKIKKRKEEEKYLVFINPKIVKISKKKDLMDEGCLSVAGKFGKVKRSTNITVEALDEKGNKFRRGAGGLLSQVLQHEIDHLDGILFVDKAENIDG